MTWMTFTLFQARMLGGYLDVGVDFDDWEGKTVDDIESTEHKNLPEEYDGKENFPKFDGRQFIDNEDVWIKHKFSDGSVWSNINGWETRDTSQK